MPAFVPALAAMALAATLAWVELVTSRYPRTYGFLVKSWALYVYCLIYGLIAFGVSLAFDSLIARGAIKAEGLGLNLPWARALEIGIAVKSLLHIRLFTVTVGSQPFPVGLESLVQIFEPWLLDHVAQDEFNSVATYVAAKRATHGREKLPRIQAKLQANIRPSLPLAERTALSLDISKAVTIEEAMIIYLVRFGTKSLDRLYP